MRDNEFLNKLNFDNIQKNIPDVKTGVAPDGSSDTPFFEYDAFMKWYKNYCFELSDVYNCNVNFIYDGMADNTFAGVKHPSETDIDSGDYHRDIDVNAKYFDPAYPDISLVKSFTDANNNSVQGISAKDAFKTVAAMAHEGRHVEQYEHLIKGTNDESLDVTMPAALSSCFNRIHYVETYSRDTCEVDAQNAGLSRGFNIMCSCFPEQADIWLDGMKEWMCKYDAYAKYMNSSSYSVKTASDVNTIMRDAFADSCIEYDSSYETLLGSPDDPSFLFDFDDIYKRTHTEIPYLYEKFTPPEFETYSAEEFFANFEEISKKSQEAYEKAQAEQTRLDDEAFMNKLDENPSYIAFHNEYMQEKLGEVNPDLLKTDRFKRLTDKLDSVREPINKAAGYYKNMGGVSVENSEDYISLKCKAREAFSELIPDYSIAEYDRLHEERDINKELQEITGIDFDAHEKEMQAAFVDTNNNNYDY